MTNFPPVGTVVCGCDDDAACTYHAEMFYGKSITVQRVCEIMDNADAMRNRHVAPNFRTILDDMIAEAKTSPAMAQAIDTLYGQDYLNEYTERHYTNVRDVERLAKVDSREVYCDRGPDGDNCLDCPTCRM